ncbi:MAG: DUF479 domain-containing protein [Bacteroidetes bacterium]|nr:MAG: DUF479 domain-containing protein [Bacteroidota bacterium]TAG85978.1 MAG: DUF479 domain-containing protein [Bacteroidota bacterium]
MNFLAHLYLSGTKNNDVLLGNFSADFVKGKQKLDYEPAVQKGFELHYFIDNFTDTHLETKKACEILKNDFGRYAGVIVDVFFDHFLSKNFTQFHHEKIEIFAEKTYILLQENLFIFPEKLQEMLPYMINQNWLVRYGDFGGLHKSLQGITKRAKYAPDLTQSIAVLENQYKDFEECFFAFFPDVEKASKEKINILLDNFL